jgi:hypothetical protein
MAYATAQVVPLLGDALHQSKLFYLAKTNTVYIYLCNTNPLGMSPQIPVQFTMIEILVSVKQLVTGL